MSNQRPQAIIPRADWDRAPWNRWTFQHVREILPTAEVWRGNGPVLPLATASQDLSNISFTRKDGSTTRLSAFLEASFTDGFLVLHKEKLICEHYFNGMSARSLHLSQSMAKSVTAAAAGVLIGRGLLDPQAPVTNYLPELKATAWNGAKLQHVLDMTSGVAFDETYHDPHSDMARADVASGWKEPPAGKSDWPRTMWDLILTLKTQECDHGASFRYRSIETDVLAFAMERATGKRLPEIISEEIWQKIGAEESACFTVDPSGYALADGGLNASLRDYARFGLLYANKGARGGQQILPESWVLETERGNPALFGAPYTDVTPEGAYHNQFWVEQAGKPAIMCRGVFGQLIYIDRSRELVVTKLSSWPVFIDPTLTVDTLAAIHAIAAELA